MLITDKGCEQRNCNSCKYHYPVTEYFYKLHGVDHKPMDGFVCAAFAAEEGIMIYMSGLANPSVDFCEMYKKRGEK